MLVAKVAAVRRTLELHSLDMAAARRFIDEASFKGLDHLWVKEVFALPHAAGKYLLLDRDRHHLSCLFLHSPGW